MPKLILTFNTETDMKAWLAVYSDGGGQDAIYDGVADVPEIDLSTFEMPEIDDKEYLALYRDSLGLQALEAAGVDNWTGYDEVDWDWVDHEVEKGKL